MSMQPQMGPSNAAPAPAAAPPPPMLPAPDRLQVEEALLRAIHLCATKAAGAQDVREVQEYAAAALNFSQSVVILDPNVVAPQGVPAHVLAASIPQQPTPSASAQGETKAAQKAGGK